MTWQLNNKEKQRFESEKICPNQLPLSQIPQMLDISQSPNRKEIMRGEANIKLHSKNVLPLHNLTCISSYEHNAGVPSKDIKG